MNSEPADGEILSRSPSQVTAWFSEELDSQLSAIRVFDSQDNQVDNGDGGVDLNDLDHLSMIVGVPSLPNGSYEVNWTAVSAADGDQTEGMFEFHVGSESIPKGSSAPLKNSFTMWLIGGTLIVFVLIVSAWLGFNRRKASS